MNSKIGRFAPVTLLALAAALLPTGPALAVNLVPNPSFESYISCPTGYSQFYQTVSWSLPNTGTSDLLNACSPGGFPSVNVPANTSGYQNAYDGVGYAGIIPYSAAADYREYLQAPLTSTLVNGNTYQFSFRVSLGDTSSIAIDRLGAYFSVGPVSVGNYAALAFTPQIESPVNLFLTDATNWMLVSGSFVAAGGEDHVIIGNFHDDASTNTTAGPSVWPGGAYYYIDAVSLELSPPAGDQACCLPDGSCTLLTPGECQALGGTALGNGTTCGGAENPCGPVPAQRASWGSIKGTYR